MNIFGENDRFYSKILTKCGHVLKYYSVRCMQHKLRLNMLVIGIFHFSLCDFGRDKDQVCVSDWRWFRVRSVSFFVLCNSIHYQEKPKVAPLLGFGESSWSGSGKMKLIPDSTGWKYFFSLTNLLTFQDLFLICALWNNIQHVPYFTQVTCSKEFYQRFFYKFIFL